MERELIVRENNVRAAAASCPEAKQVLAKLFPGVLEDQVKPGQVWQNTSPGSHCGDYYIAVRCGEYNKEIQLSTLSGNRWCAPVSQGESPFGNSKFKYVGMAVDVFKVAE